MSRVIRTNDNTFYTIKDLDDDISVTPQYGDLYEGMGSTANLVSNPVTTYIIGESTVLSPYDYGGYGDYNISEMYISAFANTITLENENEQPWVRIYNVKPDIDITEGDMVIISGQTGLLTTFSSYYDFGVPWLSETFDGTEKFLFNVNRAANPSSKVEFVSMYRIRVHQLLAILRKWEREHIDRQHDAQLNLRGSENTGMINTTVNKGRHFWNDIEDAARNLTWDPSVELSWDPIDLNIEGGQYKKGGEIGDMWVYIKRGTNGLWYADLDALYSKADLGMKDLINLSEDTGLAMDGPGGWIHWGAQPFNYDGFEMGQFQREFEDGYVTEATVTNTIFSDMFRDADVRGIKCQTQEGPGDNAYPLIYGQAVLTTDFISSPAAFKQKLEWENFAVVLPATYKEEEQRLLANPFGGPQNGADSPQTQDIVASIYGIPQPHIFDVSTPAMSGSGFAPEMEFWFKIEEMDVAPHISGSVIDHSYVSDRDSGPEFCRSFNIIGGRTAPSGDEANLSDYPVVGTNDGWWISFMRTGSSMIDVFANNQDETWGGCASRGDGHIWISDMSKVTGTTSHTQIPRGKYINARLKFCQNKDGSSGDLMMYFPNVLDSNGAPKFVIVNSNDNYWGWGASGYYAPHLTFWINNIRAMNEVPATTDTDHLNNGYGLDRETNDDKRVTVLIDSINLVGWNTTTYNSTVTKENGLGNNIIIPSMFGVPQAITSGSEAGHQSPPNLAKISSEDNNGIYGQISAPMASYISIGYDAAKDANPADEDVFTGGHKLLFNRFSAASGAPAVGLVSGGIFTANNYGFPKNWFKIPTGEEAAPGNAYNITVGGFPNSVDKFTQKGLVGISGGTAFDDWAKTGNPFCSARILDVASNGTTITVDNGRIFNLPSGTEYVIEKVSSPYWNSYAAFNGGTGSIGYQGSGTVTTPLTMVKKIGTGKFQMSRNVMKTDKTGLPSSDWAFNVKDTNFGLTQFRISPFKYWLNLAIINVTGSDTTSWAKWWETGTADYPEIMTTDANRGSSDVREYWNIVAVSGGNTPGSTYNEPLFNDGVYHDQWTINFSNRTTNIVNLTTSFGEGAMSAVEPPVEDGTQSVGGEGFMGQSYFVSGQNYFNITNYVAIMKPKADDKFNFLMRAFHDEQDMASYVVNLNTDDAATNKLSVVYGIKDMPPIIGNLTVDPVLDDKTMADLTELRPNDSDIFATWEEENVETWYRLLFVDNINIPNKYHKTSFWAPLNETGTIDIYNGEQKSAGFSYFLSGNNGNIKSGGTPFTNTGDVVPSIEGFCGYGAKFDGTDDFLYTAADEPPLANDVSKWSFVGHCKPTTTSDGSIFSVYSGDDREFHIEMAAQRVMVTHASSSTQLTSVNVFDCDGVQPLAIVVTYEKGIEDNNWKLYINGKLEDTADFNTTNIMISGTTFVGASGSSASAASNLFTGYIEEITTYEGLALSVPPNPKVYRLSTKGSEDLVEGATENSIFYTGRLFAMDYHNIRGVGNKQVAKTNTASWKITGPTLTWDDDDIEVYTEATANFVFNDSDVLQLYIDWDDGEDNTLGKAINQWKKLDTDSSAVSVTHTYTKAGTFYPVLRTINSAGFLSKYFYDNGMPDSSTVPFPKQQLPNIAPITVSDGAPLPTLKVENKITKSGIDNSIFEEGPKSVYIFVPPIFSSGAAVLDKVNKIKVKYVEAAYTYKATTANLDLGYERIVKETELTLPALDVSQAATLLTSDKIVEILDVRLVTPRIDTNINSVRNDFNKLKFFLIAQGDDTYWYPITYVSNGDPIKKANDELVTLDFSQTRAKASNTSIISYKFDDGKSFWNPVDEWQATSSTAFTNATRTLSSLLNNEYTYYTRPDGLKGGSLGLGSGTAFATGASNYYDTDNFSYKRDQFPLNDFNQFYNQHHLTRITASSSGIVNSSLDTYEGVYRITPVISTSADNAFYLDQQALSQTASYTSGAYYNTKNYPVEVSGWNSMPFIDNDAEARQASEYLLLFNDVKTNKIFFNNTPYARELMSNLTTGSKGHKIAGVYYLKLSELIQGDLFTQKAEWKPVKFRDTTKVSRELRDTTNDKFVTYEDTMTKSGFIEFDMPSDWSQISASGLCGGLFNNAAGSVVLTGDYSKPITVTGWVSQVSSPFNEYEVSTSSLSLYTDAQIGKYNYTYQVVSGNNSGNTYWVASSNTAANTLYLVSGASYDIAAANNTLEALNGIMRKVNAYDVFDGVPKTTDLAASKGDVPNAGEDVYPYTFMWSSSAFRTDLAANFNNVYPLKIVLSGTNFTSGSRLSSGPEVWDVLPYNNSYSQVITQKDNTAYDLSYLEITNDISVAYVGTYYQAISKNGKVFIKRTGTSIQQITFGGNALGNEESFSFSEDYTSYNTLRLLRRIEAEDIRVMWDEQQKDGTFVRFFGYVSGVTETHSVGGKRASKSFSFIMVIENICLLDANGELMSDVEPLGGSSNDKRFN